MDVKPLVVDVTAAALSGQGTVEVTPLGSVESYIYTL